MNTTELSSNMAALSRGFKPRKLKQYVDLAKADSEVLVYTLKQKITWSRCEEIF